MDIEKIIREYIDKSLHMSLATVSNNKPWVSEVHFVFDDQLNVYWRSLSSRRHSKELELNPNVSGNIVAQHTLLEYPHGIYFEGFAKRLVSEQERKEVFSLFKNRLETDESILEEAKNEEGHQFYKVTVKTWYAFGKFGSDSGQKYTLEWTK